MRRLAEIGPLSVSSEEDFKISSMNFRHFANSLYLPLEKNAALSPARMLYAKFG